MLRALGNISCYLDPNVKVNVKKVKMYFLVNASPPKLMDVATSNFPVDANHTM